MIALYDDNHITIDGNTAVSFTEDVLKRFEAYGWHTQAVDDGDHDLQAIYRAIEEAKKVTDKPSIIKIKTTIGKLSRYDAMFLFCWYTCLLGFGSKFQGDEKTHGSPLDGKHGKNIKAVWCNADFVARGGH